MVPSKPLSRIRAQPWHNIGRHADKESDKILYLISSMDILAAVPFLDGSERASSSESAVYL